MVGTIKHILVTVWSRTLCRQDEVPAGSLVACPLPGKGRDVTALEKVGGGVFPVKLVKGLEFRMEFLSSSLNLCYANV